jgi:hypothetical protein
LLDLDGFFLGVAYLMMGACFLLFLLLQGKWHAELSHATRNTVGDQSEVSWSK